LFEQWMTFFEQLVMLIERWLFYLNR
jgi:hypothetical protein